MTSLHGVRYLAEKNRSLLERLFCGVALTGAYICCWYFITQVRSDYNSSPVVTSIETKVTPSSMFPSPAITVCSTTHVSRDKLDFTSVSTWTNHSLDMKKQMDVLHILCYDGLGEGEYLDNDAIKYVIKNYAMDVSRVVLSVTRMNEQLLPLSEYVQTLLTPISVCFSHNMVPLSSLFREEYLRVYEFYGLFKHQDKRTSWTPDHGYLPSNSGVPEIPVRLWGDTLTSSTRYLVAWANEDHDPTCSFGVKGLTVHYHNPAEVPSRTHTSLFLDVVQRVFTYITIMATTTDESVKVWSPEQRGCYFEKERYLRYFKLYTTTNCERECDANHTFSHCGCVTFSQPRNLITPICGPKKSKCVKESHRLMTEREVVSDLCKCLPACNEVDYRTYFLNRPWNADNVHSELPPYPEKFDPNTTSLALLSLLVRKKYINLIKKSALIGPAAYVANLGGILSLFLGVSFLSLFEVIYFITLRVLTNYWNSRRESQTAHGTQDKNRLRSKEKRQLQSMNQLWARRMLY